MPGACREQERGAIARIEHHALHDLAEAHRFGQAATIGDPRPPQ
jgi:hypothetical protein